MIRTPEGEVFDSSPESCKAEDAQFLLGVLWGLICTVAGPASLCPFTLYFFVAH